MKAVTNDMPNILDDIVRDEQIKLDMYFIIYKDSDGVWDGVYYRDNTVSFYSINERIYRQAIYKLKK